MADLRLGSYEIDAVLKLKLPYIGLERYYKLRKAGVVQHEALEVTADNLVHLGAYLHGRRKGISHRDLLEMSKGLMGGTLFDVIRYLTSFEVSQEKACELAAADLDRRGMLSYKNLLREGCDYETIIEVANVAHDLELDTTTFDIFIASRLLAGATHEEALEFARRKLRNLLLPYIEAYRAAVSHNAIMAAIGDGFDYERIEQRINDLMLVMGNK